MALRCIEVAHSRTLLDCMVRKLSHCGPVGFVGPQASPSRGRKGIRPRAPFLSKAVFVFLIQPSSLPRNTTSVGSLRKIAYSQTFSKCRHAISGSFVLPNTLSAYPHSYLRVQYLSTLALVWTGVLAVCKRLVNSPAKPTIYCHGTLVEWIQHSTSKDHRQARLST